jgi:hypothetical protein
VALAHARTTQLKPGTLARLEPHAQRSQPNPDSVHDESTFVAFVRALLEDRRLANAVEDGPYGAPRGWQNGTVEDFLSGALTWAEDSNFGRTQGLTDEANPWRRLAVFLYCGKIYE